MWFLVIVVSLILIHFDTILDYSDHVIPQYFYLKEISCLQ